MNDRPRIGVAAKQKKAGESIATKQTAHRRGPARAHKRTRPEGFVCLEYRE